MDFKSKTCCFTGHRTVSLAHRQEIEGALESALRALIAEGYRYFAAGGALGFDTLAAQAVLRLRNEYSHIRLILVLPCPEQAARWSAEDIRVYEQIKKAADKVVYTSPEYSDGCMLKRNRVLVEGSSFCLAYCTRARSGTGYTVRYAEKMGLTVRNLAEEPSAFASS
jgi:uncharacterized phage-like protein YoqJ